MISEFPLFIFTTLGGMAAGVYLLSAVFPSLGEQRRSWLLPLVVVILLGIGGVALMFHLGRPQLMFYAFLNPTAGIAQEAYASVAFGLVVVVDLLVSKFKGASPRVLRIIGALCGLVLSIIMGNAYFMYSTVEGWASWQTFALFILGNLAMGAALLALLERGLYKKGAFAITAIVLNVSLACVAALEAIYFAAIDLNVGVMVLGALLAIAGILLAYRAKNGEGTLLPIIVFVCVFTAVAVARYGFYMAYGA